MSEFQLGVLVYVPLQLVSLALLPKWWKLAAIPALIAAHLIVLHDGYMGDLIATMGTTIACAYLVVVWSIVGVVKLIRVLLAPADIKECLVSSHEAQSDGQADLEGSETRTVRK